MNVSHIFAWTAALALLASKNTFIYSMKWCIIFWGIATTKELHGFLEILEFLFYNWAHFKGGCIVFLNHFEGFPPVTHYNYPSSLQLRIGLLLNYKAHRSWLEVIPCLLSSQCWCIGLPEAASQRMTSHYGISTCKRTRKSILQVIWLTLLELPKHGVNHHSVLIKGTTRLSRIPDGPCGAVRQKRNMNWNPDACQMLKWPCE